MDSVPPAQISDPPEVPQYLSNILDQIPGDHSAYRNSHEIPSLQEINAVSDRPRRFAYLLLARHRLTGQLAECPGLSPELILERAHVYESLGYNELALADAYVSYTLCLVALDGPDISDLEPTTVNGDPWPSDSDSAVVVAHQYRSLILMCRSAIVLGCQHQAKIWIEEMLQVKKSLLAGRGDGSDSPLQESDVLDDFCQFSTVYQDAHSFHRAVSSIRRTSKPALFGWSQRQVYPWNDREPDRMSKDALDEINERLQAAAPDLEVEISALPTLTATAQLSVDGLSLSDDRANGTARPESSSQLGLFAKRDLAPGSTVLEERSVLTAIRPHGEALCDCCAADMESIPREDRRYCSGCGIPFCSEACQVAAKANYHRSNDDDFETDEGYPPTEAPFCPGTSGNEDIHTLGRAESSTTPEWDLYFLLLSRTLQMAETLKVHPLDLFEIKYLWGDFSPTPDVGTLPRQSGLKTLPYSVRHHLELPLQWFEILMHSRDKCRPYSAHWLKKYDWWIIQTLFAKFRGVADAQQSTWTGKPEVAAVHPLWCLANHSCNPNVTWKPSGVRNLTVVAEREWAPSSREDPNINGEWTGIKAGEEIWNHYTDIQEVDYRERRDRLRAVLGGDCSCERCTAQESAEPQSHRGGGGVVSPRATQNG